MPYRTFEVKYFYKVLVCFIPGSKVGGVNLMVLPWILNNILITCLFIGLGILNPFIHHEITFQKVNKMQINSHGK